MADNPTLPATGEEVATKDRAGIQFQRVLTEPFSPLLSFATDTDVSASSSLPSIHADANVAYVAVEGGDIRWRPDGNVTPPTASVGMLVPDGSGVILPLGQTGLTNVRVIAASGTPTISVVYA